MVCSLMTSDNIYEYISNTGNNFFPIVWLQVKKVTICWLRILNLVKRIRLIIILYWMEYTFQIQRSFLKNWNCVKFLQIMIRAFNQTNKLTIKIYSNISHININYYLKLRIPMCHKLFSEEYHKTMIIYKHVVFACRQWYSYNNPQW